MTRQELRVVVGGQFCGCGAPADAYRTLMQLLSLQDPDAWAELEERIPDAGTRMLLLYWLDHLGWTEHGTSVRCAWLTALGRSILEALEREAADNFGALSLSCCVHGYADDEAHDCENA